VISKLLPAADRIQLPLWAGSLWVVGFVVAPVLFAELDDRALAGSTAGTLFTLTSYMGLACGALLLVLNGVIQKRINWRALVITGMLLLIVAGQFVITPHGSGSARAGTDGDAAFRSAAWRGECAVLAHQHCYSSINSNHAS
jgi:hypothetical protein